MRESHHLFIVWFVIEGRAFRITLYVVTTYNVFWPKPLKRSFQTKQLLFTRRFLSVRVSPLASRVSPLGLAARKLLSGAERRMQMASVAWNSCTIRTFALRADRACNHVAIQTSAVESTVVAKAA